MASPTSGNSERDRALIKRRKDRLAAISRLDPISKAIFCSAVESDENSAETQSSCKDTNHQQHLRDIQGRLKDGTYSVPADKLAAILTRIFLSLKQQPTQPHSAHETPRSKDPS